MMEEISIKSSFRFKALVVAVIATIITTTCSSAFGFSLASLFGNKAADEPFLNRKVYFTGDTHYYSDGSGLKLFNKGKDVRKHYDEENPGCGIISIIRNGKAYPYYVTGEGWINADQICEGGVSRYITLEFNPIDSGLNTYLHVDGEYLEIESDNNAVVSIENGVLQANAKGATEITFHNTKTGEDTKIAAVVVGSDQFTEDLRDEEGKLDADMIEGEGLTLQLSIPDKSISANLDKATVGIMNDKVRVEASGNATASIGMDEAGRFTLTAEGEGEAALKVKTAGETMIDEETGEEIAGEAQYKEIARINVDGSITAAADIANGTVEVAAEATERLTVLDKFAVALQERATLSGDLKEKSVRGTAGASVLAGQADAEELTEIAGADAGISYTYGDTDPKGSAEARILGYKIGSMEEEHEIPVSKVITGLKGLTGTTAIPGVEGLSGLQNLTSSLSGLQSLISGIR